MSDSSQGAGWWQASDNKWYPPELHPDVASQSPAVSQPAEDVQGSSDVSNRETVVSIPPDFGGQTPGAQSTGFEPAAQANWGQPGPQSPQPAPTWSAPQSPPLGAPTGFGQQPPQFGQAPQQSPQAPLAPQAPQQWAGPPQQPSQQQPQWGNPPGAAQQQPQWAPGAYGTAPPPKSGTPGWAKALLIVGGLVVLLGVGVVGCVAVVAREANDAIETVSSGVDRAVNPADSDDYEIELDNCGIRSQSGRAAGTLTNTASGAEAFIITVTFSDRNGDVIGAGTDVTETLEPGAETDWEALLPDVAVASVTCEIDRVGYSIIGG